MLAFVETYHVVIYCFSCTIALSGLGYLIPGLISNNTVLCLLTVLYQYVHFKYTSIISVVAQCVNNYTCCQ